ncbi:MAG: TrkA C-terminal domain-containing protein [Alphaproteobacteria bacterium]|nr:TrkA C-terminal domain-containing protein [Alphaproteobacteria bacterium]
MGSALALLLIIIASYAVVLVGSIAYELTGVERDNARFQALSAFTNCGFTTEAAEEVYRHPLRRRITMALMILGYAGLASVISTVIHSIEVETMGERASNLFFLTASATGAFILLFRTRWGNRISDGIRRFLTWRLAHETVPHESLHNYAHGFGLTRIEVPEGSRLAGMRIRETDLRARQLQILAIEEGENLDPIPHPDTILSPGLHLILYGRMKNVQAAFEPPDGWLGFKEAGK